MVGSESGVFFLPRASSCCVLLFRGCDDKFLQQISDFTETCKAVHSKAPPRRDCLDETAGPRTFIDQCELLMR